jgi:hypothetical protein
MKKILLSAGIILMLSLVPFKSFCYVTATCNGLYDIHDQYFSSTTDTYVAALEIVTLFPSSSGAYLPTPTFPNTYYFSTLVNNVGYDPNPPETDYYNMIVYVFKYRNGVLYETQQGSSYGVMVYLGGTYTLTAYNQINLTFLRP